MCGARVLEQCCESQRDEEHGADSDQNEPGEYRDREATGRCKGRVGLFEMLKSVPGISTASSRMCARMRVRSS